VIIATSQTILLQKQTKNTFGTAGEGIGLASDIWTIQEHIFTSQTQDLLSWTTQAPKQLGSLHRLPMNLLNQKPLEVLLIDGCKVDTTKNKPKIDHILLSTESGIMGATAQKALKKRGYNEQFWYLKAWEHGAALEQDRLVCVCCLKNTQQYQQFIKAPEHNGLPPPRLMRNLLLLVGVPQCAWAKKTPE
jgi:hypothetical protein